jgi:hypothetical protein
MPANHRTTNLFELVAAVQESLTDEEEAAGLAIMVVQDLLHSMVYRRSPGRSFGKSARGLAAARDAAA